VLTEKLNELRLFTELMRVPRRLALGIAGRKKLATNIRPMATTSDLRCVFFMV
jgi:hypothetical protein